MILEHQHFNRIKKVMENEENKFIHLIAIQNLIINYKVMFGETKLYTSLLKIEDVVFNKVWKVTKRELNNYK